MRKPAIVAKEQTSSPPRLAPRSPLETPRYKTNALFTYQLV